MTAPPVELATLSSSILLRELGEQEVQLLARAMTRRQVPARQTLFEQDRPGDSLFILVSGALSVRCRRPEQRGLVVAELVPGAVLGEMACLDPAPRTATIDVDEEAVLYELDRSTLLSMQAHAPAVATKLVRAVLVLVTKRLRAIDELVAARLLDGTPAPPAQATPTAARRPMQGRIDASSIVLPPGLEPADLNLLQSAGTAWIYDTGSLLCREGEVGSCCFIILHGKVAVERTFGSGSHVLATLDAGATAGQVALVDAQSRTATLRAVARCAVLELGRDSFEQMLRAASPTALRFQAQIAVAGIRQLRTALELLRTLPDPGAAPPPRHAHGDRATARLRGGLGEWACPLEHELRSIEFD